MLVGVIVGLAPEVMVSVVSVGTGVGAVTVIVLVIIFLFAVSGFHFPSFPTTVNTRVYDPA